MTPITFSIPIQTKTPLNGSHGHWAVNATRIKKQRAATAYRIPPALKSLEPLLVVTLTRVAPRQLDDDNLRGALKGVRDQVACALGVDDRSRLVKWEYEQEKGEACVWVKVRTVTEEEAP